jgi:calcium-dependent protein kinase
VRAVKVINKTNVKYTERLVLEITIMELMVWRGWIGCTSSFFSLQDHPNILKLFETFEDHENLYMIIE